MAASSSAKSIFFAALRKTSPAKRAAYLDEACRDNADLRRQVERLLEAHPQELDDVRLVVHDQDGRVLRSITVGPTRRLHCCTGSFLIRS